MDLFNIFFYSCLLLSFTAPISTTTNTVNDSESSSVPSKITNSENNSSKSDVSKDSNLESADDKTMKPLNGESATVKPFNGGDSSDSVQAVNTTISSTSNSLPTDGTMTVVTNNEQILTTVSTSTPSSAPNQNFVNVTIINTLNGVKTDIVSSLTNKPEVSTASTVSTASPIVISADLGKGNAFQSASNQHDFQTKTTTTTTTNRNSVTTANASTTENDNEKSDDKAVDNSVSPAVNIVASNANKDDKKSDEM